ncbi:MAG: putative quinol monooxygenase [Nitrosotalea sp.]
MEQITILVRYKIKKKKLDKATSVILEYVETIKKNESGTIEYKVFQDKNNPTLFIHVMSFVDKAAQKTHEKSEHLKKLKKILIPISKGKAVYTSMMAMQPDVLQEKIEEIKNNISSHEPV